MNFAKEKLDTDMVKTSLWREQAIIQPINRLQMAKELKSRIFSCKSPKPKLRNFQVSTNDFLGKMVNTGQE